MAVSRSHMREVFEAVRASGDVSILVGTATCARSVGALESLAGIREEACALELTCRIVEVGCAGHCYAEPMVAVGNEQVGYVAYGYMDVVASRALVLDLVDGGSRQDRCMIGMLLPDGTLDSEDLAARCALEKRVILANCGVMDPLDLAAYRVRGGYRALEAALSMEPRSIVDMVTASGLRGRGGAGYPTGKKWEACSEASSASKHVICNADEGDPGAFVDRMLMESDPHSIIEGLVIAGWAVGALSGSVYVRSEYPLALARMKAAIRQAYDAGILGARVLGSGFAFDIDVFEAAGAFVCGEETALVASMEGRRGEPRKRPPYPAESGLFGEPTVIDNVKTLAYVRHIVAHGAAWFRSIGTRANSGTAVFALAGKVARPGLVEVPMGTTVRQVVFDVGGGMMDPNFVIPGREMPHAGLFTRDWTPLKPPVLFKAVQIGGPSGGCLPMSCLDVPIDFDSLNSVGAMMGSGGLVVISQDDCMVDVVRHFVAFTSRESCGACVFCRVGLAKMLGYLDRFRKGEGTEADLDELTELAQDIQEGSFCNLGKTAPNPVLSALRHFRDEFVAHIQEKACPALVCKDLISYRFADVGCSSACEECSVVCDAIKSDVSYDGLNGRLFRTHEVDDTLCIRCGICVDSCAGINHASIVKVTPARHERWSR